MSCMCISLKIKGVLMRNLKTFYFYMRQRYWQILKTALLYLYRMQVDDLIMYGYFRIGFIDFMLKGKSLLDYTNLFSPDNCEKNDKIILYFQYLQSLRNYTMLFKSSIVLKKKNY